MQAAGASSSQGEPATVIERPIYKGVRSGSLGILRLGAVVGDGKAQGVVGQHRERDAGVGLVLVGDGGDPVLAPGLLAVAQGGDIADLGQPLASGS